MFNFSECFSLGSLRAPWPELFPVFLSSCSIFPSPSRTIDTIIRYLMLFIISTRPNTAWLSLPPSQYYSQFEWIAGVPRRARVCEGMRRRKIFNNSQMIKIVKHFHFIKYLYFISLYLLLDTTLVLYITSTNFFPSLTVVSRATIFFLFFLLSKTIFFVILFLFLFHSLLLFEQNSS